MNTKRKGAGNLLPLPVDLSAFTLYYVGAVTSPFQHQDPSGSAFVFVNFALQSIGGWLKARMTFKGWVWICSCGFQFPH